MSVTDYGLDSAQMQGVVNQTQSAIDQMNTLNSRVQSTAGDIAAHNQSDAGRIVQNRLDTWNSDFTPIVSALSELNTKVESWLRANVQASSDAAGAAGH